MLSRWSARIRGAHPDHHAIARSVAWLALFVIAGKLAGAAKEVAIAYRYGTATEVDAFLYVSTMVLWIVAVWTHVMPTALAPLVARERHQTSAELPHFQAELLGLTLLIGLLLFGLIYSAVPLLLRSPLTGLPAAAAAMALDVVPALSLLLPMGLLVGLWSAWLIASGRQVGTLLEGVQAVVLLTVLLALPAGGIGLLVWGTVAGIGIQMISLAVALARRGEVSMPLFTLRSPLWPRFGKGFGILLAGHAVLGSAHVVDQFFASHLGSGAIATLNYAIRPFALIAALGVTVISRAVLPVFSRTQSERPEQVYSLAMHWARLMLVAGIGAGIVAWWLAPFGIELLFQRGAFTREDTIAVAHALRFGLVQLPPYFFCTVLLNLAASCGRYGLMFLSGVLGLAVKISATYLLTQHFGINGILLAWASAYAVISIFLWITLRRKG